MRLSRLSPAPCGVCHNAAGEPNAVTQRYGRYMYGCVPRPGGHLAYCSNLSPTEGLLRLASMESSSSVSAAACARFTGAHRNDSAFIHIRRKSHRSSQNKHTLVPAAPWALWGGVVGPVVKQ